MSRNAVKKGFSILPEELKKAEDFAKKEFGGNLSRMVTTVISDHINGRNVGGNSGPNCVELLVESYCPALADECVELFKGVNQPVLVTKLFEALVESFRMDKEMAHLAPNNPFDVFVEIEPKDRKKSSAARLEALERMKPKPTLSPKARRQKR